MTTVTGSDHGHFLDDQVLADINAAEPLAEADTRFELGGKQGVDFLLDGTGFGKYDAAGFPHAGTMTQLAIVQGDRLLANWSGLNIDVARFIHLVQTGNVDAIARAVFSGADTFDVSGSATGAAPIVYNGYGGNDIFQVLSALHGAAIETDGGAGHDIFNYGANFDAAVDRVDGGAGADVLNLTGGSASDLAFTANSLVNVEKIVLATGASYSLTMDDANVAAGASLIVDALQLATQSTLSFDGHVETDGTFLIRGGQLNDVLIGGQSGDIIAGGRGGDTMTGGLGADRFDFAGHFGADTITDFAATGSGHDVIRFVNGFADFASLQAHMAQSGTDVVITLDARDTITLQHVTLGDLTAQDFTFG